MGKTKNKRYKGKKTCPTGLLSAREIEKEEEIMGTDNGTMDASTDQLIQSVMDKLQGANVEDKECACCSVSTLIENPDALALILSQEVIKMIAPLLVDPSCVVRHAAAGALRNLSVVGGPEVCDVMVEDDVMTPLVALVNQVGNLMTITIRRMKYFIECALIETRVLEMRGHRDGLLFIRGRTTETEGSSVFV